jgi:hypothetical protein
MTGNRRLRDALVASGLRYDEIATSLRVDPKTVERWVTQGRVPYPRHRARLANLLGLPQSDIWPDVDPDGGLAGEWWSCWQTSCDGDGAIAVQPIELAGDRDELRVRALERHGASTEAGCLWHAQLHLWEREVLLGWYSSIDLTVRSYGTLHLRLHPLGRIAAGRRVGLSHDGGMYVGWAVIARERHEARSLAEDLVAGERPELHDCCNPARELEPDRLAPFLQPWPQLGRGTQSPRPDRNQQEPPGGGGRTVPAG